MDTHKNQAPFADSQLSCTPEMPGCMDPEQVNTGAAAARIPDHPKGDFPFAEVFRLTGTQSGFSTVQTHPFLEIVFCQSSYGSICQLNSQQYELQHGDIVVVPPGIPHSVLIPESGENTYKSITLRLSPEYIDLLQNRFPFFRQNPAPDGTVIRTAGTIWENISSYFLSLASEEELHTAGAEPAMAAYVTLLLTQITRAASDVSESFKVMEKEDLLDQILAYLDNSLSEKITLDGTADRFWISTTTLSGLFRKNLGISFYQYVLQRRLREAKNLIYDGESIEKIPHKIGFSDYSSFFRAFKKEVGISPSQFRKSIAANMPHKGGNPAPAGHHGN